MFKNYLKIAWRNLIRNKAFASMNILGLAIGMASAILILLWVENELNIDQSYPKSAQLYKMFNRDKFDGAEHAWGSTPKIMAPTLKKDYPEVADAARLTGITFLLSDGDKHLNVRGAFTDSSFISMFDLRMLKGDARQALASPSGIVLTQKLAKKLFGDEDAIGKTVRVDSTANFKVTGILKDFDNKTSFDFEYLLPWSFMKQLDWDDQYWGNNSVSTFALLKPGASLQKFNAKVKDITTSHSEETEKVFAYPVSRLHLYDKDDNGQLVGGQITTVKLFCVIAIFILLIACINFMNLTTARSEKRAKEVGIRKVAGAYRYNLVGQFIGESMILSVIAFIIALLLVQLSLAGFNLLTAKQLHIEYGNVYFWTAALCFIVFTGFVAGSYPAFYLSSFVPVKVLKGSFKKVNTAITPRKVLVVLQFTFAIVLIIGTIIIKHQIDFVQNRDAGYNRESLIFAFMQGDVEKHYQSIKDELLKTGTATSVTKSANPITKRYSDAWGFSWPGSTEADKKIDFVRLGTDANFVKTIGVKLKDGRDIDIYNYPTDSSAVLVNEAAVQAMRLKDPIGQSIKSGDNESYHIVGVVKDFILESPFDKKINPMLICGPGYQNFQIMHIKLSEAGGTAANLAKAENIFNKYNPDYPFEYAFVDESYATKFQAQQRTGTLASLFAGLTIFISCLGLFGLAAYTAESRIKEIGVRKVLGASVASVATLLSKDFLLLVVIALLIASPIAYFALDSWLQTYTYRVGIEWWVFAGAGVTSILIALLTVSFQAIKAAVANPVKSLRTE
ncbi:MAG: ABC transporter permease [Ferruginibacter sp.]